MKPLSYIDLTNVTDTTAPYLKEHIIYRTYGNTSFLKLLLPLLDYYENKITTLEKEINNAKTS